MNSININESITSILPKSYKYSTNELIGNLIGGSIALAIVIIMITLGYKYYYKQVSTSNIVSYQLLNRNDNIDFISSDNVNNGKDDGDYCVELVVKSND